MPAVFEIDPRGVPLDDMVALARDVSRRVAAVDRRLSYNYIVAMTHLARELVASTEGVLVDQCFALTQGLVSLVAADDGTSQEMYDVVGHQRGWEILLSGIAEPVMSAPAFEPFALAMAREGVELVEAPPLPTLDHPVTVVTDPHFNALVSHEVIGHPVELDRALKMETAYAGRSWLLRALTTTRSAGRWPPPWSARTPTRRCPATASTATTTRAPRRGGRHIERGILTGFMNSRQTAAVFGGPPNGHWKATDAALVPLIRMSNTVFAQGDRDPAAIIGEVDHGYYLAGHKIPSIAESRENFRISARAVYEIHHGRLGGSTTTVHHGRQPRLPHGGGRGRTRLPSLPDPQLRQGAAHADQAGRQRRPHHAQPRHGHRRRLSAWISRAPSGRRSPASPPSLGCVRSRSSPPSTARCSPD